MTTDAITTDRDIELGSFELDMNVSNIAQSVAFYETLGFKAIAGSIENKRVVLKKGDCRLGLYEDYLRDNVLSFFDGNVFAIAAALKKRGLRFRIDASMSTDGVQVALLEDPDGNELYFIFHPEEKFNDM